jgi:hypothetical protein
MPAATRFKNIAATASITDLAQKHSCNEAFIAIHGHPILGRIRRYGPFLSCNPHRGS